MSALDMLGLARELLALVVLLIALLAALRWLLSRAAGLASKQTQLQVVVGVLIIVRIVLVTVFPALATLPLGWTAPPSSFARLQDGLFWSVTHSPYAAGTFHGSPLLLALYQPLLHFAPHAAPLIGVAADICCALLLATLARDVMQQQQRNHSSHAPQYVAIVYLANPITLLSRMAMSLVVWSHLAVLVALWAARRGRMTTATLVLALSIHLDVYNTFLIIPVALFLATEAASATQKAAPPSSAAVLRVVALTAVWCVSLYAFAVAWTGDSSCWWHQLRFVWSVSDLAPCTSLAWYFFTQLFDRFQSFFLVLFQLHLLCYLPPLAAAFWYEPCQLYLLAVIPVSHFEFHTLILGSVG